MPHRQFISFLTILFITAIPSLTWASTCQDLANTMSEDINKYGDDLKNHQLPWMKLTWLQSTLGTPNSSDSANDITHYEWRCDNEAGFVVATVDKNGELTHVKGQYASAEGSGLFSADIPQEKQQELSKAISEINASSAQLLLTSQAPVTNEEEIKCNKIISQIRSDIASFPSAIQAQHLPWMKLAWLRQELGQAQVVPTYEYVYKWDQFGLYLGADGSRATTGSLPQDAHPESLEDITKLIGQPKRTVLGKLNEYRWMCPGGSTSSLVALADKNNIVTNISGKDCSKNGCTNFSTPLENSDLERGFRQQMQIQASRSVAALNKKLAEYNSFYKTTFERQDELMTDITMKLKNYYSSLRQCTPGVYRYALPVSSEYLFNTAVILKDKKEGRCQVETSYDIPHIGTVSVKCKFQPESLALFSENEAISAANGNTSFNAEHPSAIQQATENECKRYINGVL